MTTGKQPQGRQVASSALEELGKSAARLAKTSGLSLTEAATQTLKTAGLNADQVRRAVEFCNIAAVNDKYASSRGPDRIVDIDGGPADPAQVVQTLKAASAGADLRIEALEYSAAPQRGEKRSSAIFQKVASVNLAELRDTLQAAHEELTSQSESAKFAMQEDFMRLKAAVKTAGLQGATLHELVKGWSRQDHEVAKVASAQFQSEVDWGDPVSSRTLNNDHPVMQYFGEFAKSAHKFQQTSMARANVEEQLHTVENRLRGEA
jgi:hypothetical protein